MDIELDDLPYWLTLVDTDLEGTLFPEPDTVLTEFVIQQSARSIGADVLDMYRLHCELENATNEKHFYEVHLTRVQPVTPD